MVEKPKVAKPRPELALEFVERFKAQGNEARWAWWVELELRNLGIEEIGVHIRTAPEDRGQYMTCVADKKSSKRSPVNLDKCLQLRQLLMPGNIIVVEILCISVGR